MNKIKEILILEKHFDLSLEEYDKAYPLFDYENCNSFELNEKNEVIGLNLSYNNITDLSALKNLKSLKYLQLESNEISDITAIKDLASITLLNLSYNNISDCSALTNFKNITDLNLETNVITDISFLKNLIKIESLNLTSNRITDLSVLKYLKAITDLSLGYNEVIDFSILKELVTLTSLNVSNNFIDDYSFLKKLSNLSFLNISSNQISNFSFIKDLSHLKSLNLSNNDISEINFVKSLININHLDLSNNMIYELSVFENFNSEIISLNLNNNSIDEISALKNLMSIKFLNLDRNNIVDIYPLNALKNITTLSLSENLISDISVLGNLNKLESLDLRNNHISDIKSIKDLIYLRFLTISDNKILNISALKNLKQLNSLIAWANQITDISPIKNLTKLRNLDFSNNQIADISPLENLILIENLYLDINKISNINGLKNLSKLNLLVLEDNQISDFRPIEGLIRKLHVIKETDRGYNEEDGIYLSHNISTIPPVEVIEQGNETILQYFNDATKYGLKALNECKLILVGEGGLGKTSLMKKIVGLPFSKEVTTHGINKKSWNEVINENGENIKVNLWDFGGQHIQHSLHQFFLTEKVIYILLLDPRNDTKALYWMEQIDKLGKDSEVLIVYNCKDSKDRDSHNNKNFFELRKTYPNLRNPFVLSCKDNYGFEEFKSELVSTILSQNDLLVQYPLNWFKIKDELEKDVTISKNYIAYNEYDLICKNNKYTNETNKKNLLKQLDKIGSIVFFDKPILNDLQVLNPDWITTGAYSVITSEITRNKKGHLNYNDLKEIFKDEKSFFANEKIKLKYKEKDFQFILALMTDYDLCVINPFEKDEYLVPCAFEGEKPVEFDKYKKESTRYRFQFESSFEMLIMYRFMARNISNCVKNGYWQSGIVIKDQHSKTFALVETNLHSKIIDFWIKGDNIRGLWEVLRRDIKDINSKYSLKFKEEVLYISPENRKEVFLSYDEMIDSLKNGLSVIPYHPTYRIRNIDVLKVIDNFEDSQKILNAMNKEGHVFNVRGNFITNGNTQIGGQNNTQNSYINNYSNNTQIQELKDILEDFEDVSKDNKEWQENFCNALKELYRLEQASDEIDEKKSISKLQKFFTKAKEVKDWVAISVLPAEIATKGAKMMELGEQLFSFITK
ncbi:leucine-rich repeat domain-containing protein [Flavobacterium ginsenosidimutans]|uniref:leucine-rich repeat domain-containing protein n=1 Tax=Flavobacterium ginsenosidimutans TaxID=687844 RepID=UPI000DAE0402|nr:leucine-rich repeat domain-containing protein [Flavobacterium ginsenosidimutans]KAF2338709.1 hypothetical protein DM444_01015 [Flavobacterium ginsenosidimutans]